jgi:hypothetical protein
MILASTSPHHLARPGDHPVRTRPARRLEEQVFGLITAEVDPDEAIGGRLAVRPAEGGHQPELANEQDRAMPARRSPRFERGAVSVSRPKPYEPGKVAANR